MLCLSSIGVSSLGVMDRCLIGIIPVALKE
jgi:hypothetical protein